MQEYNYTAMRQMHSYLMGLGLPYNSVSVVHDCQGLRVFVMESQKDLIGTKETEYINECKFQLTIVKECQKLENEYKQI